MNEHSHAHVPASVPQGGSAPSDVVVVAAMYKDPTTGALFVHRDLFRAEDAWAAEAHIGPVKRVDKFGDVESFAEYVRRYGEPATTLVKWNSEGIGAILDFHTKETPNRAQWSASYPFIDTLEWGEWKSFADGSPVSQRSAIEFLEDNANDIREPAANALMTLLRSLKAWTNANAAATYNEDGTAKVSFAKETGVRATNSGEMELPGVIKIGIPLIEGHPDVIGLNVRVRVIVDDDARLAFRFTIPRAEEVLDQLRAELAQKADEALNRDVANTYTILRAAD